MRLLLYRFGKRLERTRPRALPGGHLAFGHYLPGIPDEEEAGAAGRGLRVRPAAAQHHLAQLQLYGAAAAVRVSGSDYVLRGGGRQPIRHACT